MESGHGPRHRPERVRRLVGVYHADGSLVGEVRYWIGARLGRAHCALCDITHGTLRAKPAWSRCRDELPVEFDTVHLDERDAGLRAATEGRTPCVVAETAGGWVVLVGPRELDDCEGSIDALMARVVEATEAAGLSLRPG